MEFLQVLYFLRLLLTYLLTHESILYSFPALTSLLVEVVRFNVVVLGANLCCQVFFDSALARHPEKGSAVQVLT